MVWPTTTIPMPTMLLEIPLWPPLVHVFGLYVVRVHPHPCTVAGSFNRCMCAVETRHPNHSRDYIVRSQIALNYRIPLDFGYSSFRAKSTMQSYSRIETDMGDALAAATAGECKQMTVVMRFDRMTDVDDYLLSVVWNTPQPPTRIIIIIIMRFSGWLASDNNRLTDGVRHADVRYAFYLVFVARLMMILCTHNLCWIDWACVVVCRLKRQRRRQQQQKFHSTLSSSSLR